LVILQKQTDVRYCLPILFFLLISSAVSGQKDSLVHRTDSLPGSVYLLQKVERNGETLPEIDIKQVNIMADKNKNKNEKKARLEYKRYDRLVDNLKVVYPYALLVRSKLSQVNEDLGELSSDRERNKYIRDFEKDLFSKYEDQIRDMTVTQGRLLLKLIDRETQNTSFELIRQYRGGLTAAFWQGVARIFGTNLKEEYDPYGEDAMIEIIVQEIEAGRI